MDEWLSILGGRIVDAGVAAALVSGSVALAMVVTRQPSRRRALARAGVLGSLLVVPLVWLRPFDPFDLLGPVRLAARPIVDGMASSIGAWPRWAVTTARVVPVGLLIAYLAGLVLGLARLALGAFGAGWIGRNSRPASDESRATFESLPTGGGRAKPRLRVSGRTTRPVLLGTFRPTILIPPDLDRPEAAPALRLALLHELAHAGASDPWFGLANELATVVWFWLPPIRWIGRQMRLDQEFLADRSAADLLGTPARYASALVEIAATKTNSTKAGPAAPAAAGSALLQRVLMLVRSPFPVEGRPPRWWRGLLGLGAVVVLLLATGLTLRARPHPEAGPDRDASAGAVAIPRIVLDASGLGMTETTLPIRLPRDFDLTFEVVADASELARIEVLGQPLGPGRPLLSLLVPDAPREHSVRILRRDDVLSVSVDGAPPVRRPGASTDDWLVARGLPDRPTVLRSLHLAR